jgi:hypothetical protein
LVFRDELSHCDKIKLLQIGWKILTSFRTGLLLVLLNSWPVQILEMLDCLAADAKIYCDIC